MIFDSWQGPEMFYISKPSSQFLWPIQAPASWVPQVSFSAATSKLYLVSGLRMNGAIYPLLHTPLRRARGEFTFTRFVYGCSVYWESYVIPIYKLHTEYKRKK
jgi:hypothetical protein